jgi:N-acetylneuraminic acid mutarotase
MFGGTSGGTAFGDTWALDVTTKRWVSMKAAGPSAPPKRSQLQHAMVYDSANDVFVLFGGICGDAPRCAFNKDLNDTWVYKLSTNTWTRMTPAVSPPARRQQQMVYDSEHQVVVLFGGKSGATVLFGGTGEQTVRDDLWTYSYRTNTWTQLFPATSPAGRAKGTLVYDPGERLSLLYNGGTLTKLLKDVWTLRLQRQ